MRRRDSGTDPRQPKRLPDSGDGHGTETRTQRVYRPGGRNTDATPWERNKGELTVSDVLHFGHLHFATASSRLESGLSCAADPLGVRCAPGRVPLPFG